MSLRYYEQNVKARLKEKRKLSGFLEALIHKHRRGLKTIQLAYIFCDDEYLLAINKQFLNHNTLTDIITFDLSIDEEGLHGEIYISTDRVKENALAFSTSYNEELHRVIIHGALHLCGFKDKTKQDKELMRKKESACLKSYFKD
jgi:probable rRNA maturation factor